MNIRNAYESGDVRPHSYGMAVPFGSDSLRAEVFGLEGAGLGMANPDGVTAVIANGVGEGRNTNRLMAAELVRTALACGIDVSAVVYDDGDYYRQASYSEAVATLGRCVRRQVADDQNLWWLPHSRGGISLAQAKDSLLADGAVQTVFGMANPYTAVGGRLDVWNMMSEVHAAFSGLRNNQTAAVYSGFVYNIGQQMMRPHNVACMLGEIVSTDVSAEWNELAQNGTVQTVLAQYEQDGLVDAAKNTRAMRRQQFSGRSIVLPGNHARPLVDPKHASIILEHSMSQGMPTAA